MREVQLWELRETVLCSFGGNWCSAVQDLCFDSGYLMSETLYSLCLQ